MTHYSVGHPALTPEELDQIADAYLGGATLHALAAQYHVSAPAIAYRLKQRGISGKDRTRGRRVTVAAEPARRGSSWMDSAACGSANPELFFPTTDPSGRIPRTPENLERIAEAKRHCGGCGVRAECLQTALDEDLRDGVWGGLTPEERSPKRVAAQRKRVTST